MSSSRTSTRSWSSGLAGSRWPPTSSLRRDVMGLLENRVVLITGGARGRARAHAVTSAREGADVVIFDAPGQLESVPYPLASADDLQETARLVEKEGRRAIALSGDVRSQDDLDQAVSRTVAELGKLDILIANAGVLSSGESHALTEHQW